MDIWNMPHVEDGDKYYIRKEYTEVTKLDNGSSDDNTDVNEPQDEPAEDTTTPTDEGVKE